MFFHAKAIRPSRSVNWMRCACAAALLAGASACDRDRAPSERSRESAAAHGPTGQQVADTYSAYWGFYNRREFDRYQSSFASKMSGRSVDDRGVKGRADIVESAQLIAKAFPDSRGEPEVILVTGMRVFAVVRFTGTMDGPLDYGNGTARSATHARVGVLMGHGLEYDASTMLATGERSFLDPTALLGQADIVKVPHREPMSFGPLEPAIVVASGSAAEQEQLGRLRAAVDAFNRHDAEAVAAACTSDVVWYDSSMPEDVVGADVVASLRTAWSAFPDLKLTVDEEFAVGDYAVEMGSFEGTNDGEIRRFGSRPTHQKVQAGYLHIVHFRDGKIDRGWRFVNGFTALRQLGMVD